MTSQQTKANVQGDLERLFLEKELAQAKKEAAALLKNTNLPCKRTRFLPQSAKSFPAPSATRAARRGAADGPRDRKRPAGDGVEAGAVREGVRAPKKKDTAHSIALLTSVKELRANLDAKAG